MSALLQRLTSPPAQILETLQPTSSTVQYTVSTRPVPRTFSAKLAQYVAIAVRVIVGIATLLLLWTKWATVHEGEGYFNAASWTRSTGTSQEATIYKFIQTCEWAYLLPSAAVVLYLVVRRGHTEESLTVLRGLGVQTFTTSSTYLQTPSTRFIPTTSIQDIIIHEAFKGFEIGFYLAIVVEGEQDAVVVFPLLLPRRHILEEVWRGARRCLWDTSATTSVKHEDKDGRLQ